MFPNNYNQAKAIASLICPYLCSTSPKTPYRWRDDREEEFNQVYQLLQTFGVRKGFFESKRDYVMRTILTSRDWFEVAYPFIEFPHVFPDGSKAFWTGAGQYKKKGSYIGPAAFVQINTTKIWDEISPLLQKIDSV